MDRNQNSHFALNPEAEISRSRFDRSHSVKFSFNAGDLIPFYVDEVLPGDTFTIDTNKLVRMQPLVAPVMDDIYLDTYYFFVPNRLTMTKWKNLMGENTEAPWYPRTDVSVPQVYAPGEGWMSGTIADYMGIPVGVSGFSVSSLPFKAYALIWNEWFRDENLQYPQEVRADDLDDIDGMNAFPGPALDVAICGGFPLKAAKFKDYFTSCLPAPQKGPDVLLPLGTFAPVYSRNEKIGEDYYYNQVADPSDLYTLRPTHYATVPYDDSSFSEFLPTRDALAIFGDGENHILQGMPYSGSLGETDDLIGFYPSNLWTDLQNATAASINQLRLAFQMQRIYEKDARGGSRYIEIIANHFGVTSPDSRLQRPEYLGGNRMLVNVNQVIQTSETATTPQGNVAAYSLTVDQHSDFTHSFVEHGFLIGVCVARYVHSYQQGVERFWTRKNRFDYYFPSLANIGEQPVYTSEIYLGPDSDVNAELFETVFGYQEAWADYRYKPNRVAGELRTGVTDGVGSLGSWTLTDYYDTRPTLSSDWISEYGDTVNRALAVGSGVANQFFADFYIRNVATRPMPLFSIPGLIDHH